MLSVKGLVEYNCLSSIPSESLCPKTSKDSTFSEPDDDNINIPIIDFSQLTSSDPTQCSKAIQQLGHACRDWGFFMLINHGVSERMRDELFRAGKRFFDLTEKEKKEYSGTHPMDGIRYGTRINMSVDQSNLSANQSLFWRDYLKLHVHPHFHAPPNPSGFSEIIQEYCQKYREVIGELLKGISISLGLPENYIHQKMNIDSGFQLFAINYYPPCPKPEIAMGLPAHTDHGLLTLLTQNEVNGLQIQHHGKWLTIHPLPNSFLVNTADHLEILTNGKYKSVVHRALVNTKAARISIATAHGPTLDTIVNPAPELVNEAHPPAFHGIKYWDYMLLQLTNTLDMISCLDHIRI